MDLDDLCLVKTSSGRVSPVRIVAAWQSDPEERLNDELDGEVGKHERNSDKRGDRHDGPEGERDQPLSKGLPRLAVVVVLLEDAAVAVASRSLSPHVSVMQPADAGQRHHLRVG